MPGKIFISYRRDDVAGDARGIRDGLAARFGRAAVFMDVDDLLAGQRFDEELAKALDACDVLIAVIGPRWMDLLRAKTASSERDYVREEIGEALRRRIVVIPVRVGREGQMPALPQPEALPEDIRNLVLHQKHDVAHERFGRDLADLAQAIVSIRKIVRPQRGRGVGSLPWAWAGGAAVVLIAVFWAVVSFAPAKVEPPKKPQVTVAPSEPIPSSPSKVEKPKGQIAIAPPAPAPSSGERGEAPNKESAVALSPNPASVSHVKPAVGAFTPGPGVTPLSPERERALKRGDTFKECDVCPEMVAMPADSFMMGSPPGEEGHSSDEGPQREVTIVRQFAVGKFEVTFAEWDACVTAGGCKRNPGDEGWGRGKRPVINLSWDDITKEYLPWLGRKTGKTYRLLTEAEWEYAARAGSTTPFSTGRTITTDQANFNGQYMHGGSVKGVFRGKTVDVGSFKPNAFGLHDMHGNVWEWVQDCYKDSYVGAPVDGSAVASGDCNHRVVRGGSWVNFPLYLRSADRAKIDPARDHQGFRVGRTLDR